MSPFVQLAAPLCPASDKAATAMGSVESRMIAKLSDCFRVVVGARSVSESVSEQKAKLKVSDK